MLGCCAQPFWCFSRLIVGVFQGGEPDPLPGFQHIDRRISKRGSGSWKPNNREDHANRQRLFGKGTAQRAGRVARCAFGKSEETARSLFLHVFFSVLVIESKEIHDFKFSRNLLDLQNIYLGPVGAVCRRATTSAVENQRSADRSLLTTHDKIKSPILSSSG